MNSFKTMLLAIGATALLSGSALAAPPQPVKQTPTTNRLFSRGHQIASPATYKAIMRAPGAGFISVASAATDPKLPTIIGGMLDSRLWETNSGTYGLYEFPATDGQPFRFIRSGIFPNGGGVEADGVYYSCEVEESTDGVSIMIRAYDTETWRNTRSFSPNEYSFIATDVAHDPLTGQIYGCLWDTSGSGYMFGTIDYVEGVTHKIKALDNMWNAVAIDADGTIYAIDQVMKDDGVTAECVKSSLYKVDRTTGALTLIGDTGLLPYYASSAVIDHRTGRMFWSVTPKDDSQSALYEVNKKTGACTLIYRYPGAEQFMGMYIPAPLAEDAAPAAPADVTANFAGGSLSGSIDFTVPSLTYGGDKGSGSISYTVYADGITVAEGATQWGKKESVPITLRAGGEIEFTVALTGEGGISPKAKIKAFIGTDIPEAPAVKAAWADGVMTVDWTTPSASVNGGYIDPAAITYKVTRMPDGIVVAGAATTNTFSEKIAAPATVVSYYYTVEATYDRKTSAPGVSNRVVLGAAAAPYSIDFTQLDNLDDVTVINVNPDSRTWELSVGALLIREDRLMEKDDWVITAPLRLLPGNVYAVNVQASSQGTRYPETIEVFCGESNTAEAMTQEIIGRTVVATPSSSAYQTFTGYIATQEERTVFIGVHACSEADVYNLRLASISVTPDFSSTAPGAPTDFTVLPDAEGALSVAVSLKAPAVDYDGNAITSLSRLSILRDGEIIFTKENPAPGETVTYTDTDVLTGEHVYSALAYNTSGRGREIKEKVFVGVGTPVPPAAVTIAEEGNTGKVTLTWAAVTTDANGYPLNPALVTYDIYEPNADGTAWQKRATGVNGTSYTFQAAEDTQIFAFYAVAAVTSGGASDGCVSEVIPVGPAFTLPYAENFAGGSVETLFTATGNGGEWQVAVNDPQYLAQADDNGFAKMLGEYYGSNASLISGKIDLAGAVNPVLKFSSFNYFTTETGPDYNAIDVYVRESAGEWKLMQEFIVNNMADQNRWGAVAVELAEYTGKTVQLLFHATNFSYDNTVIDRIRVENGVDQNLSLTRISAPDAVEPNTPFTVTVTAENTGLRDTGEFTVQLLRDGVSLSDAIVSELAAGRQTELKFEDSFSVLDEEPFEYQARVIYQPDMVAGDNTSEKITVRPVLSLLPVVTGLTGVLSEGHALLSWNEPDTDSAAPDPITENFETAESYATTSQCGWTFVDADGAPTQEAAVVLGVVNPENYNEYLTEPGIGDQSPASWVVIDHNTGFGTVSWFTPHNGSKLLMALAAAGKANDDWAISPALYGGPQTVTFWAKSRIEDPEWGIEKFEVLYSTGGTATADFKLISSHSVCSLDWVKFSFDLPDGAKHFAVRCVSNDAYSMMIDDFTFIPEGATADISLLGYNIYRDGAKINAEPAGDTTFADTGAEAGGHTYIVTALYDRGESRGSNSVYIETTGASAATAVSACVSVEARTIIVSGAQGSHVTISAADGKVLFYGTAPEVLRHNAAQGVYLVSVDGTTAKVAVR